MFHDKKITSPEAKEAIAVLLNDLILSRIIHKQPMETVALEHYIAGVQDTYMELTQCIEPFVFNNELARILKENGIKFTIITGYV